MKMDKQRKSENNLIFRLRNNETFNNRRGIRLGTVAYQDCKQNNNVVDFIENVTPLT